MLKLRKILIYVIFIASSSSVFAFALDTINKVDKNNMKQGHWVYTNQLKKLPNYSKDQVIEEGDYADNSKTGKWFFYYNNDKVKHVVTYLNNRPNGYAIFYYRNGSKKEEGIWKNNKWIGDYKYYYENGNLRNDWKYSANGKRTGVQKYYHENGQLQIEGKWANGNEAGTITEYYNDGSVKSERIYNKGKIDNNISKNFKIKEKAGKVTIKPIIKKTIDSLNTPMVLNKKEETKNNTPWNGTGTRSFLNRKGQVVRKGYFEKGYLMDGVVLMYTLDGKKYRTTHYKEGRIVKVENHQDTTISK